MEGKRRDDRPLDKEETAAPARNLRKEVVNTGERCVLQSCRATGGRRGAWWGRKVRGEKPGGDGDDVVMKGDNDNEVRGGTQSFSAFPQVWAVPSGASRGIPA